MLEHDGRPTQHVVGLDADGAWLARAPHIAQFWGGAGDVFTALLTGLRLAGMPLGEAVARATALMQAADRAHPRAGRARAAPGRDRLGRRARRARTPSAWAERSA